MAKFNKFRYELLPHPADLAPCDYFLFPNLKKWFGGKRFTTERAAHRTETEAYFEGLDKSYYSNKKVFRIKNRIKNSIKKVGESLDQISS